MNKLIVMSAGVFLMGCSKEIEAAGVAVRGLDWPGAFAFSACVAAGAYVGKLLS